MFSQVLPVEYDRTARSWRVDQPNPIDFGSGAEAKRKARMIAISLVHPNVFACLNNILFRNQCPKATDRILDATELFLQGNVLTPELVRSSSNPRTKYAVSFEGFPKKYSCGCKGFSFNPAIVDNQTHCKHTLAVHLAWCMTPEVQ